VARHIGCGDKAAGPQSRNHVPKSSRLVGQELDNIDREDFVELIPSCRQLLKTADKEPHPAALDCVAVPSARLSDHGCRMVNPDHCTTGSFRCGCGKRQAGATAQLKHAIIWSNLQKLTHYTNIEELTDFKVYEGEILVLDPFLDNRVLGYLRIDTAKPDAIHFDIPDIEIKSN
jgi:hypothetical protein